MSTDEITCGTCRQSFAERQLRMKSMTVQYCPHCGAEVRSTEGFHATNLQAVIMEDVSAIDAWLDTYGTTNNKAVTKDESTNKTELRWDV